VVDDAKGASLGAHITDGNVGFAVQHFDDMDGEKERAGWRR
jgi:hypothetical protein